MLQRRWADDPGALGDIRVPDATVNDWLRLIEVVAARWPCSLGADGEQIPSPSDLNGLFALAGPRSMLLRVRLTPLINLHAYFPDYEGIEFDFDPQELLDQADLDDIVDFVTSVGRALRRTVRVVVEGGDAGEMDYMRYDADGDRIVVPD